MEDKRYKEGQFVRVKCGCVWLFGQIDQVKGNGAYEVSYGSKKRYNLVINSGWPFDYFADFWADEIRPI